jgi:hypothetical protein
MVDDVALAQRKIICEITRGPRTLTESVADRLTSRLDMRSFRGLFIVAWSSHFARLSLEQGKPASSICRCGADSHVVKRLLRFASPTVVGFPSLPRTFRFASGVTTDKTYDHADSGCIRFR